MSESEPLKQQPKDYSEHRSGLLPASESRKMLTKERIGVALLLIIAFIALPLLSSCGTKPVVLPPCPKWTIPPQYDTEPPRLPPMQEPQSNT